MTSFCRRPGRLIRAVLIAAAALLSSPAPVAAFELAPFKDGLFAYPGILAMDDNGYRMVVDYQEKRDIHQRDEVPEKKVRGAYVDLSPRRVQREAVLETLFGSVRHMTVGRTKGARLITIYLHGQGGNRLQGVNDYTFGGNFNRIKNLMARNGGVYLSGEFPSLNARGVAQAKVLLQTYIDNSPGAPVFVACGSLGGRICWGLAEDPEIAQHIDGYLLMGSTNDQDFFGTAAFKRKVPVYLGHGTGDIVINWKQQDAFFKKFKQLDPNYPVKFALFNTGSHGTPIRMTDWRLVLNWMLEVNGS